MGIARIIIGLILTVYGFLLFMDTMMENTPTPNSPLRIPNAFEFADTMLTILVESIIIAIGVVIFGWGMRAHRSPRD